MAHIEQARRSVERLHRLLVVEGVRDVTAREWKPINALHRSVEALKGARKERSPSRKAPRRYSSRRRGRRPFFAGGPVQRQVGDRDGPGVHGVMKR